MPIKKRLICTTALLLTLTACGGGSDPEAGGSTTSPSAPAAASSTTTTAPAPATTEGGAADEAALKAAVQAYSDAYLTGDADAAYELLSARCQKRMSKDEFTVLVGQAKKQFGEALPFKSYDAEINGTQARVTYTYSVAAINQDQEPWALEDGAWHEDDC